MALRGLAGVSELAIQPGHTVVIIGKPGTGKSTIASWLMRSVASAIVYETKGDVKEQRAWQQAGFVPVRYPDDLELHPRALLLCSQNWLQDRRGWANSRHPWSVALEHPFRRHPSVLLFDEALQVFPVKDGHPGTHRLLQQGRSFGHVPIILSQLANNIDTRLLRLSQHIVVMGPCRNASELSYLERANGVPTTPLRRLPRRGVAWWSEGAESWSVFEPIDPAGPLHLVPLVTAQSWPYPARHVLPRRWYQRRRQILTPTVPVTVDTWQPEHTPPGVCDPPGA